MKATTKSKLKKIGIYAAVAAGGIAVGVVATLVIKKTPAPPANN